MLTFFRSFLMFLLFVGMASTSLIESVDGFVEFKKYKVTNSDKVCGDKLCSDIDEQIAKQGRSSHNIEVCGIMLCSDKSKVEQKSLIQCKEDKQLVVKATTLSPACVNISSVEKLQAIGWTISELHQQEMFDDVFLVTSDARLSITSSEISNQQYLVIDGYGWHRLHNVEITISSSDFNESIRSKTTDDGYLNTLWSILNSVEGKVYNIFATDGIAEFELDIPISSSN